MRINRDDLAIFKRSAGALLKSPRGAYKLIQQLPAGDRAANLLAALSRKGPVPAQRREPNRLERFFDAKRGRGIQKWRHYFEIYDRHFQKFVGREVHIVEVGVASGGSMDMWRDYFGGRCHVYGIDVNPACKQFEREDIQVFIGDQGSREFWRRFRPKVPVVDIFLDDGSHKAEHQIVALEEMLPHLSSEGVYLCEDIEKRDHRPNDFLSYLFALDNELHQLRFAPGDASSYLTGEVNALQSCIRSICFYPFVAVIEKQPTDILRSDKRGGDWL
ncbi:MAG TPA: class I SAM-dependent methyltransferase [Candidatus Binatia bacterium]|jgi:hypothetical protein